MKGNGKRVPVTGGSSGIGLAIAHVLRGKGAKVVITGRRPGVLAAATDELKAGGGQAWAVSADVGTPDGRAATLRQALDALGRLDILVDNAGGGRAGRLAAISAAEIEAMVAVELPAPAPATPAGPPG